MYVTNGIEANKDLYECSGVEAEWLMYTKKIPLFSSTKDGKFYFAKTENLNKALKEIPFWLKVKKFIR